MKLSELILAVGDDKVKMQSLDTSSITLDWTAKKGTRITFGTDQQLNSGGTVEMGLVIWLPREAVDAALAAEKAGRQEQ